MNRYWVLQKSSMVHCLTNGCIFLGSCALHEMCATLGVLVHISACMTNPTTLQSPVSLKSASRHGMTGEMAVLTK
jgi:hypothetical protein